MTRRRLSLAMLVVIAIFAVFVVRLVDIQVVRADELNTASFAKRAVASTTYAARGDIVDRNGEVLAGSVMRYDITTAPRLVKTTFTRDSGDQEVEVSLTQAATELASITSQAPIDILTAFTSDPTSNFEYVSRSLTVEQMRAVRALDIPWIYVERHPARIYPGGAAAGNLVGFTGTDGPLSGLELSADSCLKSTDGSSTYERGADGIRLPGSTVTTRAAVPGSTVTTTIDRDLQWAVRQTITEQAIGIGAESALATVVDVKTGEILAMADYPSVDPNDVGSTAAQYRGALTFSAAYEPGSIFKPMTAAMLLDQGAADPTTRVTAPYRWVAPDGSVVRDANPHPDLRLTLAGVIEQSSNVGISQLAVRLPNAQRYEYMRAFGVGQTTGIGLPGEASGILSSSWDAQQKYDVSYGQGVSATLAQVAGVYQTLGNGGVKIPLSLVSRCDAPGAESSAQPAVEGTRVVSESAADSVVQMMEGVVTGGNLASALQIPGYRIAAKSGTAEIAENQVYTRERVVSIAGLAPAEDPQFAVVVMFVKPTTIKTSAAAAPTFNKIMTQVLTTYRVTPSTTAPPLLPTTW